MLALAFSLLPTRASAQPERVAEQARALFERGIALAAAGEDAEAADAFEASLALVPRASTALNLAIVRERLGRPAAALRALDRLAGLPEVAEADRRDARALRARLADQLGALRLRGLPEGAVVQVDGETQPGEGGERYLVVATGAHRVRVDAPGHVGREWRVAVTSGEEARLQVALEAEAPAVPTPAEVAVAAEPEPSAAPTAGAELSVEREGADARRRRLAIGLGAAGAVLVAVTTALLVALLPRSPDYDGGTTGTVFR